MGGSGVAAGAVRAGESGQPGQEPAEDAEGAAGPGHAADREASDEADREAAGREAADDVAAGRGEADRDTAGRDAADENSPEQDPDLEGGDEREAADVVRLELPARDSTGDPAVDEALTAFDQAQGADLTSHVRAAEAVHEALQRRLGDAHS
ncbi:hypothetical protein [Barrientosiimonas humi]|uniref:hypothetical protein n=1 Tax=Barrientosiimonas humi TaxID=999931 RepID=UPI00114F3709|nr:hypothetical protein [Barrientosiimonas humi]